MQFLKAIFQAVIAVVIAIFAYNNWSNVEIALWGGMVWETKLPVPIILSFLLGLIPALLLYRTTKWRLRRRLDSTERALASIQTSASSEPAAPMPPAAAPIAVPPGVA